MLCEMCVCLVFDMVVMRYKTILLNLNFFLLTCYMEVSFSFPYVKWQRFAFVCGIVFMNILGKIYCSVCNCVYEVIQWSLTLKWHLLFSCTYNIYTVCQTNTHIYKNRMIDYAWSYFSFRFVSFCSVHILQKILKQAHTMYSHIFFMQSCFLCFVFLFIFCFFHSHLDLK